MIKVGLIGRGGIAASHEKGYAAMIKNGMDVKIEAYCDIRPERLEGLDARTYTDIDTFIAAEQGKLDYVDICLPTYLHAETAIKALKAGFNVLSEKPMALNPEQADAMIAAAKESGKQFMIAHCCRFMGGVQVIKEVLDSGELGKPRSAEFYREGGNRNPMGYQNWFRDAKLSGGAMLDLHIHDVDVINMLFGMPKAVSAVASNVMTKNGGYDAMSVNYMYEDGLFVNAKCDWSIVGDKFNTRAIRVNFENGYIFSDRTAGRDVLVKVDGEGNMTDLSDRAAGNAYQDEIVYFIECLKAGKPVEYCPPEQSADAVRIVMAEMKSADNSGEKITL